MWSGPAADDLGSGHGDSVARSCRVRATSSGAPGVTAGPHRAKSAESTRGAIWVWPVGAGAGGLVLGTALSQVEVRSPTWAQRLWPGDSESASTLVQLVAASAITVTTLTFSLTVLSLQLASQQFSPRLLRQFTRDPVTRIVLSVLVATFALAVSVLRHLSADAPVPHLAVLAVTIGGLASLAALLGFITHIVRVLRVDTMMASVHSEARAAIAAFYPPYGDDGPRSPSETSLTGPRHVLTASRSGFVRRIDVDALVTGAKEQDVLVQLLTRPGDHVVAGTPLGVAWNRGSGSPRDLDPVEAVVRDAVDLGYERTVEQDSAFGFRQLQDIAVKALSPGINDPVTAAHAIGYMADLLVRVLGCRLGATAHEDNAGHPRAIVPDRDVTYYLDLSCGQVRRYASSEPTVLNALLRMLRDAAVACRDDHQRGAIAAEVERIVDSCAETLLAEERESVTDLARRVHLALGGDLVEAYSDRAGETRSL